MTPEQVTQIVRDEISRQGDRNTFSVAQVPRHIHNGVDAPFAFQPIVTYIGMVGVPTNSTAVFITATGAFAGGETSATLTTNWLLATGVYDVFFDNGDERQVQLTVGATTATWTGALSGAASADMTVFNGVPLSVNILPTGWTVRYDGTGEYTIIHNLGSADFGSNQSNSSTPGLYTFIANAVQSTNVFAIPVISPFLNETSIVFLNPATGLKADTGFCFHLVLANNKKPSPPISYYGTYVT